MSVSTPFKHARPLMSRDMCEARLRAITLYRAFYRYIPYMAKYFDIPKSEEDIRMKLREMYYKNARIRDTRVIDLLVIKGYMELAEIKYNWQQKGRILANWEPTLEPQPTDFISKFLRGPD